MAISTIQGVDTACALVSETAYHTLPMSEKREACIASVDGRLGDDGSTGNQIYTCLYYGYTNKRIGDKSWVGLNSSDTYRRR